MKRLLKPVKRSHLRRIMGMTYYSIRRYLKWISLAGRFSHTYNAEPLGYLYFTHQTPLIRKLKDADMWMQQNKKVNLKIAASSVDGITIAPGEVFSYWRLTGRPTRRKGYLPGMILRNGEIVSGCRWRAVLALKFDFLDGDSYTFDCHRTTSPWL